MVRGPKLQDRQLVELVPEVEEDNPLTLKNETIGKIVTKGKKFTKKVLCKTQYTGNSKRQKHYLINLEFRKDLGELILRYIKAY